MLRGRATRRSAAPAGIGSDTDALQTDVMRFMSILALCLMAVFALVQSIPLHDKAPARAGPEWEKLLRDAALQSERAQALQAEIERLAAQTRSMEARSAAARQSLSAAQVQLTGLVEQTRQARAERERVAAELEALERRLAESRSALAETRQAAARKAQSLTSLERRVDEERRALDGLTQRLAAVPAPPPAPDAAPAGGERGFTLRFASDEALERLVASGAVSLYAMAGKQAWRLSAGEGGPGLAPHPLPGWFHEMEPSTVPAAYLRAAGGSARLRAQAPVVWGVQLPPATRQAIADLTQDQAGGELVIEPDGRVRLQPE